MAYRMTGTTGAGLQTKKSAWSSAVAFPPNTTNFSIFARMNVITNTGDGVRDRIIFASDGPLATDDQMVLYCHSNSILQLWDGSDEVSASSTVVGVGYRSWAVSSNDAGASKAYRDGSLLETNGPIPSSGAFLSICQWNDLSTGNFDAAVWDVRLWSVSLSAAEVAAEHASPIPVRTANLAAWWPLQADFGDRSAAGAAALMGYGGSFTELQIRKWQAA